MSSHNQIAGESLDANLVLRWMCQDDAPSATVVDSVGTYTGSLQGDNTEDVSGTGPTDYLTKGFDFDGSTNWVEGGPTFPGGGAGQLSVVCWAKISEATPASAALFGGAASGSQLQAIWDGNDLRTRLDCSGAVVQDGPDESGFAYDAWFHYALTYDGASQKVYFNAGTAYDSDSQSGSHASAIHDLELGAREGSFPWPGSACDFCVFNRGLSEAEVGELKAGPEPVYQSNATFASNGAYNVGTWDIPSNYSGSNGSLSYEVIAVDESGTVLDSDTSATGTLDISGAGSGPVYLLCRTQNLGGYDVGDFATTRRSGYGSVDDGYYEIGSVNKAVAITGVLADDIASPNTDFTVPGFGTPSGAIVFVSEAYDGDTSPVHAKMSIGFWDGTTTGCGTAMSNDGVSTTQNFRRMLSTTPRIVSIQQYGAVTIASYSISNITDGVRITMESDNTGVGRHAVVVLLPSDWDVDVTKMTMASSQDGISQNSSLSFEPDFVLGVCVGESDEAGSTHNIMSWGCAINDGSETQRMAAVFDEDGLTGSSSDSGSYLSTEYFTGQYFRDALSWGGEITAFASDGYTITTRLAGSGSDIVLVMAVNTGGQSFDLRTTTTPTSTGEQAVTSLGFDPSILFNSITDAATVDTAADGLSMSVGVSDGTNEYSQSYRAEEGASTTDSSSRYGTEGLYLLDETDGTALSAASVALDSDGYTYDYSTADAARLGWTLAIGEAGGTVSLTPASCSHAHTADSPSITQTQTLTPGDASHTHTADDVTLTQEQTLTVDDATHSHTADTTSISQAVPLAPADATHAHTAEDVTLTVDAITLTVADATHLHTADTVAITQEQTLTVADATHSHTADNVSLSINAIELTVDDATHAHMADATSLTQSQTLTIDDATHAHTADAVTLTQEQTLAVADATHAHTADTTSVTMDAVTLAVQDAIHAHTAESPAITQTHVLMVADATHAHTADVVTISLVGVAPAVPGIEWAALGEKLHWTITTQRLHWTSRKE